MQWKVRGYECNVLKERLFAVSCFMILQAIDSMICRCCGYVIARFIRLWLNRFVVDQVSLSCKEITIVPGVERSVKTTGKHIAIDVPFATVVTAVPSRFQSLRQQFRPLLANTLSATWNVKRSEGLSS